MIATNMNMHGRLNTTSIQSCGDVVSKSVAIHTYRQVIATQAFGGDDRINVKSFTPKGKKVTATMGFLVLQ